eukprot:PhF_6_TR7274/c0_g1_i1/m.10854
MSQSLTLRGDLVSVQNTPLGPCSITFHRDVVTVDVTIPTDPEQDGSDSARISIDYRDVVKVMVRETRVCVMLKGPWDTFGGIEVEDLSSSSIKTVFSFSSPDDCDQMVRAVTEYGELAVIQLSAPIASTSAQSGIVRPKVSTTLCSIVRGVVPRTPSAPPAPVLDEEENLPPHSDESVGGPITAKSPSKGFVDVDDHQDNDASVSEPSLTKHKSSVQVPEEVREEEDDDDEDDEVTEQKPDDDNYVCVTTPHMVDALLQLQQEQLAFHQEGVQLIEEGEALQWSEMIKSFRDGKRKILAKIPPKKHTVPSEPKKKRKQSEHQNDASMTVVLSSSCVVTQPPPCVLAVLEKLEMEHMEEYSEILRQELQARCNFIPKHAALTRALTHTEWLSGWKVFQRNEKEERALLVCRMTSTCTPKVVKPNNNSNNSNNNAFSFAASVVTPQLSNRIGPKKRNCPLQERANTSVFG